MTGRGPVTVAVTDHAVERFRQRVGGGSGALDVRPEIVRRVGEAWLAGRVEDDPSRRATVRVADLRRRDVVFVCRWDRPNGELLVVTLWEEGGGALVPRRFTDELRRIDRRAGGERRRAVGHRDGGRGTLWPMSALAGLHTAMVTPFRGDGTVDEDAAVALGRHLLASGSDGLVVCGTTGEAATLDDEEHVGLVRLMAAELGAEGVVIAGAGSNDTRHATELTERVVEAGVHAVLSVTPYYNKPNRRGIRRHFEEVARAAQGTPVILYNIPGRTATNMPPDLLEELAQIDGIDGLKQSNEQELQPIDGLEVFAGNDDILARNLDLGGAGGICVASHVVGPEMRRLVDEPAQRAEVDASLQDVYAAMFVTASPAPVKAALTLLGHRVGGLRLPLVECDDAELSVVRQALERHGLLAGASA